MILARGGGRGNCGGVICPTSPCPRYPSLRPKEAPLPSNARYRSARGTEDILPDAQPRWRSVRDTMVSVCERYSYGQIDTPIFEDYNLFVRGVGEVTDIVEKEMYLIPDRSGSDTLALRPEATAAVCRAYLQHGLHTRPQPIRLYTVMAPMFRYSRPQSGRLRQFHQLNVEAIGDPDATVDAEILGLCWQVFAELGLKELTLQLNSIGDAVCRPGYVQALRGLLWGAGRATVSGLYGAAGQGPFAASRLQGREMPAVHRRGAPKSRPPLCRVRDPLRRLGRLSGRHGCALRSRTTGWCGGWTTTPARSSRCRPRQKGVKTRSGVEGGTTG